MFPVADFELEHDRTKPSDTDTNSSVVDPMTFEGPSSEEDNPLVWDPVVEARNKHVELSQVDSGKNPRGVFSGGSWGVKIGVIFCLLLNSFIMELITFN